MNHPLFPESIYKEVAHYKGDIEVELNYDGREEGNYSTFIVYANAFGKPELDILFSHSNYPGVSYNMRKGLMYVEVIIEL